MAEVLSQSQIDALLGSMMGGGGAAPKEEKESYRKYDFYSPKKFTKDKLKIINSAYENYSRICSSRLNSLLRTNTEVSVVSVEEQRYYEFSNALDDNDVLTMVNARLPGHSKSDLIMMHVSSQLMLSMIDRMLGGFGTDIPDTGTTYTYTDVELALYENIVKYLVEIMKDGWSNYLKIDCDYSRLVTNPGLMQEIGRDEIVVIVVLDIDLGSVKGKINICLPATHLVNIFKVFDTKNMKNADTTDESKELAEEIFDTIKGTTMEIKAELGDAKLFLQDIYNLHIGDVIDLNKPKNAPVYLYIEGKPWFKGQLGVQNKNMAIKIDEVCDQKNIHQKERFEKHGF